MNRAARGGRLSQVEDRRKRGWFWGENAVMSDNGASANAKLTYLALARYADASGRCWPLITTLAASTSLSRSSVKRALVELAAMTPPRIEITESGRGRGASSVYQLLGWPKRDGEDDDEPITQNHSSPDPDKRVHPEPFSEIGSHRPDPLGDDGKGSTPDRRVAHTEPPGGSQGAIEGRPLKEDQGRTTTSTSARGGARDALVVFENRDGQHHELPWPRGTTLIALYNARRPAHWPAAETVGGTRLEKANRYVRMFPEFAWWLKVFDEAHESPFLSGKTRPGAGHEHFTPDFDWLTSKGKSDQVENCLKVHDRKYRRQLAPASSASQSNPRAAAVVLTPDDEASIRDAQSKLPWRRPREREEVDEDRQLEQRRSIARGQARSIGA